MSGERLPDWPPIISAARRPRWILWRDIAITLCMWGIFLLIVEIEFAIVWDKFPSAAVMPAYSGIGIGAIRSELRPAVLLIILLVSILGVSTLFSRRRRADALLQPQPSQATDEDLAHDLGLSSHELEALRKRKVITLDVDAPGSTRVALAEFAKPE